MNRRTCSICLRYRAHQQWTPWTSPSGFGGWEQSSHISVLISIQKTLRYSYVELALVGKSSLFAAVFKNKQTYLEGKLTGYDWGYLRHIWRLLNWPFGQSLMSFNYVFADVSSNAVHVLRYVTEVHSRQRWDWHFILKEKFVS